MIPRCVLYESSSSPPAIVHRFAGLFMAGHFSDKSVIFLETGCSSWKVKRDGRTSFQLDAICCFLFLLRYPLPADNAMTRFMDTYTLFNLWSAYISMNSRPEEETNVYQCILKCIFKNIEFSSKGQIMKNTFPNFTQSLLQSILSNENLIKAIFFQWLEPV